MDDGERKAGGDGGVDGITPLAQDIKACVGGEVMDADNHSVAGADGLFVLIWNHVLRGLLSWDLDWDRGYGLASGRESL
jgi:hypothetical protein